MKCMPFWKGCNRNVDFIDQRHRGLNKVPDDIERYSRTLEELLLDSNQIKELPKSLFRLEQLRKLTVSDNQLTRITADVASLVNLQELDISKNDIGQVTESIKHCKNLQVVDLSNNPLQELPQSITCLKNLTHLILNDSSLTRLPHDIGNLVNLECLEARENFIQQLPESIGDLVNLKILDVGNNAIDSVPESISQLINLEELRMDCNDICEITSEIGNLKKLTELDLSENKLERLPQEIGYLASLTDLHLSQNQLDYLPDGIGNLKRLTTLKLDQNRLVQLTPNIGNCVSLQELVLTDNLLSDMPGSIGKLKNLSILMVDKNKLTSIPPKIGGCMRLGVLSLRDNIIWKLPAELGFLKELHVLDISGNRLQHLPMSLNSCNLKALWLSENQAQPLLKFQQDLDEETGEKVLTCFLLPQQAYTDSMENILKDTFTQHNNDNNSRSSLNDHSKSFVKFADDAHDSDSDDETTELNGRQSQENHFVRHNTPHPKDLRVRHNRMSDKNVDGHMIPHKVGKAKEGNSNFEGLLFRDSMNLEDASVEGRRLSSSETTKIDSRQSLSPVHEVQSLHDVDSPSLPIHNRDGHDDGPIIVTRERLELRVVRQPGIGLGISIAGGLGSVPFEDNDEGIFVSKVNPSGAAERCGVFAGDKLLSVNGRSTVGVEHSKAVEILKTSGNDMHMVVSRRVNSQHMDKSFMEQIKHPNSSADRVPQSMESQILSPPPMSSPGSNVSSTHLLPQWSQLQPSSSSSFLTNPQSLLSSLSSPPYQLPTSISSPSQFLPSSTTPRDKPSPLEKINNGAKLNKSALVDQKINDRTNEKQNIPIILQKHMKQPYPAEEIQVVKVNSALGLSIVGGVGHSSLPFGAEEPGIFISKITKFGPASKTHLRVGDRLLAVNDVDITQATHQETVNALVSSSEFVNLLVRHDPQPSGMKEVVLKREPGEVLGLTIMGGEGVQDEGIFISKVMSNSPASRTGVLKSGQRILEVNGKTLLGVSQNEAISVFSSEASNVFDILVCDGLNMSKSESTAAQLQPPFTPPSSPPHSLHQSTPATLSSSISSFPVSHQNGLISINKISAPQHSTSSKIDASTTKTTTESCIERLDAIISEMNTLADAPFTTKPPVPKKPIIKPSTLPPLPPVLQNLLTQPAPQKFDGLEMRQTSSSMDDLLSPSSCDEKMRLDRKSSLDVSLKRVDSISSQTSRVSSEEQRKIRAEQRKQARLKFLEDASTRIQDSLIKTHEVSYIRPPNIHY